MRPTSYLQVERAGGAFDAFAIQTRITFAWFLYINWRDMRATGDALLTVQKHRTTAFNSALVNNRCPFDLLLPIGNTLHVPDHPIQLQEPPLHLLDPIRIDICYTYPKMLSIPS